MFRWPTSKQRSYKGKGKERDKGAMTWRREAKLIDANKGTTVNAM